MTCVRYEVIVRLSLLVLLSTGGPLGRCQDPGAGDAAHFLRDGLGGRARGMGGAFVAVVSDVTSTFWNPAGLAQTPSLRVGGSHESRYGGLVSLQYGAVSLAREGLGCGVLWVGSDMYSIYHAGVAGRLGPVSLGGTVKVYSFSARLQTGQGIGFDMGASFRFPLESGALSVSLVTRDIGWSAIRWRGAGAPAVDHAAWVTRVGVALEVPGSFGSLMCAADCEVRLRRPPRPDEENYLAKALQLSVHSGLELWVHDLAVRGGVATMTAEGGGEVQFEVCLGAGVRWGLFSLDGALVFSSIGSTFLVSIECAF